MISYYVFLLICFIVVIINLIFLYKASFKKDSVLDRFTNKIRFLPGIFVALSAVLTYSIFLITADYQGRDTTFKMVDRGWIVLNKEIHDTYDKCPTFVNSLFGKPPDDNVTDSWIAVYYLSNLIFQAFEDFLTSNDVDESDPSAWINIFMKFAYSRPLFDQWNRSKHYYAVTSQRLGDLIFQHSLKLKNNHRTTVEQATTHLIETDEYKDIIKTRHSS
jgi:hypothetical protein